MIQLLRTSRTLRILATLIFILCLSTPSEARRLGRRVEGMVQGCDVATKHATLLTNDGKTLVFRWLNSTTFNEAAQFRKGARVVLDFYSVLLGEDYVTRVEVIPKKR